MNREKKNRRQRECRLLNGNIHTKRYEKTKSGKLMRCYRNMQSRVTGILKKKAHLYYGLEILSRQDFYRWANESDEFHRLYDDWVDSGYQMKLSPSIDRIDASLGYTLENMRWLTHSENSRLGALRKPK